MNDTIRVALIDDHSLFRQGVRQTLHEAADIDIVAEGESAEDAIMIAERLTPDLMLMDVNMPGGGIVAATQIAKEYPNVKIMLLTVSESEDDVSAAMDCGVLGYALKGISGADLVQTVRAVSNGSSYITPALAAYVLRKLKRPDQNIAEKAAYLRLTAREEAILALAAEGLTNQEIGDKIGLREKTVKHYMTTIMQKLDVRNRVEAVLKHHGKK
jgi:DNA-binding NarL/FixJ family response regulator